MAQHKARGAKVSKLIEGRLNVHRDGYAFLIPDKPVPGVDGTLPLTPAAPDRLAALDERWDLGSSLRRALGALTERG